MRSTIIAVVAAVLMILLCGGCAARPSTAAAIADPHTGVPSDFSLDLAILAGAKAPQEAPVHLRPGRFILFPDGSLHYGDDPERFGMRWRPSKTRLLNREQMARLWALVQAENLDDPATTGPMINAYTIEPARDELLYVLAVSGGDQRWLFERSADPEDADSSIALLVRELGELAWATDIDTSKTRVIPKRYDFGPDPYAPYRR